MVAENKIRSYLHKSQGHVIGGGCVDFDVLSLVEEVQAVGVVDDSDGSFKGSITVNFNPEEALKLVHFGSGLLESLFG